MLTWPTTFRSTGADLLQGDFANAQENYYSETGEVKGRWCGRLAEEWNLKGEVTSEQYERLVMVNIRSLGSN